MEGLLPRLALALRTLVFVRQQKNALKQVIRHLREMPDEDVGGLMAGATDLRHRLEEKGHNPLNSIEYVRENLWYTYELSSRIEELQAEGNGLEAAIWMVWCQTARAAVHPTLLPLARAMWIELARGIPYVETASERLEKESGILLDIDGFDRYPTAMGPVWNP